MRVYRVLARVFAVAALVLSHTMCAEVAGVYSDMYWGYRFGGYSAPPSVAFYLAIPFGAGIAVCVVLALVFRKKSRQ